MGPDTAVHVDPSLIDRTPITTYGEVFRGLPEVNVNNFGQGGIDHGISLRGFTDAEHGRDIAYFVDGVPQNEVSSIHTLNYADLNPIIPETVERLEIIRGPFSVQYGDSNLGGVVNIITKRTEPSPWLKGSGGSFATSRGLVTYGQAQPIRGWVEPYLAVEGYTTDGYRDNQDFRRVNVFNKYTVPLAGGALSSRVQYYSGNWGHPAISIWSSCRPASSARKPQSTTSMAATRIW
jgi:outer membrane cobalamin receptor